MVTIFATKERQEKREREKEEKRKEKNCNVEKKRKTLKACCWFKYANEKLG